jgi:pimeloyl-ACP methyl ester carboxylesterase
MPISATPYREPRFATVNGRRMAYIDEGVGDAIVFQHGNPTSAYLWRNIMPHGEGLGRLIACDLIGMGRSDKLPDSGPERYSYREQRDYLFALWDQLNLGDQVIMVLHDWGSLLLKVDRMNDVVTQPVAMEAAQPSIADASPFGFLARSYGAVALRPIPRPTPA